MKHKINSEMELFEAFSKAEKKFDEPTLHRSHLLRVLQLIPKEIRNSFYHQL